MPDQSQPQNRLRRGQHWRIGIGIVSLMFLLVALKTGFDSLAGYLFERDLVRSFQPIQAEVVAVKTRFLRASRTSGYYGLIVTYQFELNGRRFESSRCGREGTFGDFLGEKNALRHAEKLFPKGAKVTAYFNPANPAEAYLLQPHVLTELIGPALLSLIATPGLFIAARLLIHLQRRRTRQWAAGFDIGEDTGDPR